MNMPNAKYDYVVSDKASAVVIWCLNNIYKLANSNVSSTMRSALNKI